MRRNSDNIHLSGTLEQCQEAATELGRMSSEQLYSRLEVPCSKHGRVMGAKGYKKSQIEKETGVLIMVSTIYKLVFIVLKDTKTKR